jgi:tRNA dimethylallyltransferase
MVQSIVLTGPTAVGKTSLALEIAETAGLEIINADSVCFYRHFNIGSAKPSALELKRVPHHLVDVADPLENYHAGRFLSECTAKLNEIHSRGKRALIVGGSGFYLKVLRYGLWDAPATSDDFRKSVEQESTDTLFERLRNLDPVHAEKVGPADRYRLIRGLEILSLSGKKPSELEGKMSPTANPAFKLAVIDREKEELEQRMRVRIEGMIRDGWIEETEDLKARFPESKVLRSVGYAQILDHLNGTLPSGRKVKPGIEGLIDEVALAHRQLAKQQRTWFKNLQPDLVFQLSRDENLAKEKIMESYQ